MERDLRCVLDENDRQFIHPVECEYDNRDCSDNSVQPGGVAFFCSACNVTFHGAASSKDCPCCYAKGTAQKWKR